MTNNQPPDDLPNPITTVDLIALSHCEAAIARDRVNENADYLQGKSYAAGHAVGFEEGITQAYEAVNSHLEATGLSVRFTFEIGEEV